MCMCVQYGVYSAVLQTNEYLPQTAEGRCEVVECRVSDERSVDDVLVHRPLPDAALPTHAD